VLRPAVQATVGGHTPVAFTALPSSLAAIQAGQVRAIGIAATERAAQVPDVATFAEQGITGQEADTLTGIVAPAGQRQKSSPDCATSRQCDGKFGK